MVGFPMMALVIILGALWADIAWGTYWSWDPKETASLVTWLIYGGYLHARVMRGWRGERSAALLILGFGATLFTYYGNLFFGGLHSYGVAATKSGPLGGTLSSHCSDPRSPMRPPRASGHPGGGPSELLFRTPFRRPRVGALRNILATIAVGAHNRWPRLVLRPARTPPASARRSP